MMLHWYKLALATIGIIAILALALGVNQVITLRQAHSSFANYYAFRGCARLLQKAPTYGVCKTQAGQTIKIVEFRGKWYLNNDLPPCIHGFCF